MKLPLIGKWMIYSEFNWANYFYLMNKFIRNKEWFTENEKVTSAFYFNKKTIDTS